MTTHSTGARQAYITGADAAVDALSASAEAHRASGDMTRLSETETWLALAREDQAAAVAGVDAEQLAAMGPESVMTEPAPCCGYPEADPEAGHEPRAWARAAAKRQAWALARRRSRELLVSPDSHVLGGGAGYDMAEGIAEHDQVLRWILRLPEEQQAVIALIMDGFGLRDIAHILKIPLPLAERRLREARSALTTAAFLEQRDEDRRAETARQGEFARGRGPASRPQAADPPCRVDTDLAALPPRQQEVLRLSRHGYKPAEIARALAISPNTVRVNLFHARKRIRQDAGAA